MRLSLWLELPHRRFLQRTALIIDLADISGVDKMAIVRFEAGRKPHAATVEKLRKTFNERGVIFIGAVDTCWEATVAMKHGMKVPAPAERGDDGS